MIPYYYKYSHSLKLKERSCALMRRLQRWWKGEAAPKAAVDAPPVTQCQIDCSDVTSLHALVTRQAWFSPDACALIHTEEGSSNMVPVSFAELEVSSRSYQACASDVCLARSGSIQPGRSAFAGARHTRSRGCSGPLAAPVAVVDGGRAVCTEGKPIHPQCP